MREEGKGEPEREAEERKYDGEEGGRGKRKAVGREWEAEQVTRGRVMGRDTGGSQGGRVRM